MKFLLYKTDKKGEVSSKIKEYSDGATLCFSGLKENISSQGFVATNFAKLSNDETRKTLNLDVNVYKQTLDEFIFNTEKLMTDNKGEVISLLFISDIEEGTHVIETEGDTHSFVLHADKVGGDVKLHMGRDRRRSHLKNYFLHTFKTLPNRYPVVYEITSKSKTSFLDKLKSYF